MKISQNDIQFGLALSYHDDNRTMRYFSYGMNLPEWVSQSSFSFQDRKTDRWDRNNSETKPALKLEFYTGQNVRKWCHYVTGCFISKVLMPSAKIFIPWMFIYTQFIDQLPVGLLAQLVERCTGIAEVMGSNPVRAWKFFSGPINNYSFQ